MVAKMSEQTAVKWNLQLCMKRKTSSHSADHKMGKDCCENYLKNINHNINFRKCFYSVTLYIENAEQKAALRLTLSSSHLIIDVKIQKYIFY